MNFVSLYDAENECEILLNVRNISTVTEAIYAGEPGATKISMTDGKVYFVRENIKQVSDMLEQLKLNR